MGSLPSARYLTSVPFVLCRNMGVTGLPCYPTNVDLAGLPVHPCYDGHRGRCALSGVRIECKLYPLADGKPCSGSAGPGVCSSGQCQLPDAAR